MTPQQHSARSGKALKPLKAKKVRIEEDGAVWGYGLDGYVVGAGVRVVLCGTQQRVTEAQIRKRVEAVIRAHLAEIVELSDA